MLLTDFLSLLSYTSPDHLPNSDTAHNELDPPMIITEKAFRRLHYRPTYEGMFSTVAPSS